MPSISLRLLPALLLGLALSVPLAAQNASLVGTVKDPQGALVPRATVSLTNSETGVAQSTLTDDSGNFEFSVVRPGSYEIGRAHV